MAKSADVSSSTIQFEEGLSVIDNLAKNDPAQLVRILDEVIDEAETLLSRHPRAARDVDDFMIISENGYPIRISVADQEATIKMAKEILKALK